MRLRASALLVLTTGVFACSCGSTTSGPVGSSSDGGNATPADAGPTDASATDAGSTVMSASCTVTTSNAVGVNYTAPPATMEAVLVGGSPSVFRVLLYATPPTAATYPTLQIALSSLAAGTQTLVMKAVLSDTPPSILFEDLASKMNCTGNLCQEYGWGTSGGGTITVAALTDQSFQMTVSGALMEPLGGASDGGMNTGTGAAGTFTLDIQCPLVAR